MRDRSSRSGMRELTVRAMLHGAALGRPGDAEMAAVIAADIDNPELSALVTAEPSGSRGPRSAIAGPQH
jgi:hypothetical protein